MFVKKRIKKGFTVAEVLVAAAIFMVFSGALFSIYRMGSRMYVSGSWKFIRQKEAERFFEILKERIEQASNIVKIEPAAEPPAHIQTDPMIFKTKTGALFHLALGQKSATPNKQLMEFAVCKPCQVLTNKKLGIIVLHSLTLVPDNVSGLYDLCLRVKRIDDNSNLDFFTFGCADNLNLPKNDYLGNPKDFGLQPVPTVYKLRDVCGVSITLSRGEEEAAERGDYKAIRPSLVEVKVKMRNPKHDQTVLDMGYKFKIDGSVEVEVVK